MKSTLVLKSSLITLISLCAVSICHASIYENCDCPPCTISVTPTTINNNVGSAPSYSQEFADSVESNKEAIKVLHDNEQQARQFIKMKEENPLLLDAISYCFYDGYGVVETSKTTAEFSDNIKRSRKCARLCGSSFVGIFTKIINAFIIIFH